MRSGYIENFNGRFRDEALNDHCFMALPHAREVIANWRRDDSDIEAPMQ